MVAYARVACPILRSAMSSSDGEREEDAFDFEDAPSGDGGTRSPPLGAWAAKVHVEVERRHMLLITAADAPLGPRVILIGLLMLGPCCALSSTRRVRPPRRGPSLPGWPSSWLFPMGSGAPWHNSPSSAPS